MTAFSQPEEAELQKAAKEEDAKLKKLQSLFEGCCFFLAREVPREALTFVIRSFGGVVSWEESGASGAPFPESDESITHQVVDRPTLSHRYLSRLVCCDNEDFVYMSIQCIMFAILNAY